MRAIMAKPTVNVCITTRFWKCFIEGKKKYLIEKKNNYKKKEEEKNANRQWSKI